MGSFLEDINKAKDDYRNKNKVVIDEIVDHFQAQLNDPSFENKLKNRIIESINQGRTPHLQIEYWGYHDGCSETHYAMSLCKSFSGNDPGHHGSLHNGVDLGKIRFEVTQKLSNMYSDKLASLGLNFDRKFKPNALDYPTYDYQIFV